MTCPTCDQIIEDRHCSCGYTIPKLQSSDAKPTPEPDRGGPLTPEEQRAYFAELKANLSRLGHGPTKKATTPQDTINKADTGPSLTLSKASIIHPCGCMYSDKHILLAMCWTCRNNEEALLTAQITHASRKL